MLFVNASASLDPPPTLAEVGPRQVVTVLQDWVRVYMLAIALWCDPRALGAVALFFLCLAYTVLVLFNCVVLRRCPLAPL